MSDEFYERIAAHEQAAHRATIEKCLHLPMELRRRRLAMGDPKRGVYEKFTITRTDGKSAPGEKHDGCDYFVLDLTHDKFATAALRAYADACRDEYPSLAADLLDKCDRTRDPWNPLKPL